MQEEMVLVGCPTCIGCGGKMIVEVEQSRYDRWQAGELIQVAFDNLTIQEREYLKSGIHPTCWTRMFGDEEE